jgi:hypothetical protein
MNGILRHGALRMLMVVLSVSCAGAGQVSRSSNSGGLTGSWRLVRYETWDSAGQRSMPMGNPPSGYAAFDASGIAMIQLMKPVTAETKGQQPMFGAYYGMYTVNASRTVITIRVEGSNLPDYIATNQVRPFRITGDTLRLGVAGEYQATLVRMSVRTK